MCVFCRSCSSHLVGMASIVSIAVYAPRWAGDRFVYCVCATHVSCHVYITAQWSWLSIFFYEFFANIGRSNCWKDTHTLTEEEARFTAHAEDVWLSFFERRHPLYLYKENRSWLLYYFSKSHIYNLLTHSSPGGRLNLAKGRRWKKWKMNKKDRIEGSR